MVFHALTLFLGSSCFCVGDLSGSCRSVRSPGRSADIRADPRYSRFVQQLTEQPYRRFARMRADDQQMHGWDGRVRRVVARRRAIGGPSRGSARRKAWKPRRVPQLPWAPRLESHPQSCPRATSTVRACPCKATTRTCSQPTQITHTKARRAFFSFTLCLCVISSAMRQQCGHARNVRAAAAVRTGSSSCGTWPSSGKSSRRLPGMSRAKRPA